jgi:glutathionyl-hydroquinone reductase
VRLIDGPQAKWKAGDYADSDGQFRRPQSSFRNTVSSDAHAPFSAEPGRYALYVHYGCPWAHRTIITRALKGLEDVVQLIELDGKVEGTGWVFTGRTGPERDPLYGFKSLRQIYEKADPDYAGVISVPVLWDKKSGWLTPSLARAVPGTLSYSCRDHRQ